MTTATPPVPPREPADVPAELDLSGRPRRRPPRQSEIRGINTIASLPEPPRDADDADDAGDAADPGRRDDPVEPGDRAR